MKIEINNKERLCIVKMVNESLIKIDNSGKAFPVKRFENLINIKRKLKLADKSIKRIE